MNKKKKIVILGGGISKEREISIETARSVYKELRNNKYKNTQILEPDKNLIKNLKKLNQMRFLMLCMALLEKMGLYNQF